MNTGTIAFLIVCYGHTATLPHTLNSLAHQTVLPATVIVVDNGDGACAELARDLAPSATVLVPGTNLGFAGACQLAADSTTSPILALLNPDVVLDKDWSAAVTAALAAPDVGIVGSRLLYPDGRMQHAGGTVTWPLALSSHHAYGQLRPAVADAPREVDFVTGAALAIRRSVWDSVHGLDVAFYPAYYEEVDLCLRVAARGLKICYAPTARGIHDEAAALGRASVRYHRLYHLNRLRLLWKHRSDHWLITTWLPAELAHLRASADDGEIAALAWAYQSWHAAFAAGEDWHARILGWDDVPSSPAGQPSEMAWMLQQLSEKRTLRPMPFTSRWPAVAVFRSLINCLATETYLRPLLQQQNDFNAAVNELAMTVERQRRATDAAILAQGMLLAKRMLVSSAGTSGASS
ncbi:MAG: hypothetical protein NVSMB42_26740 [Herpetosiphon sp.]